MEASMHEHCELEPHSIGDIEPVELRRRRCASPWHVRTWDENVRPDGRYNNTSKDNQQPWLRLKLSQRAGMRRSWVSGLAKLPTTVRSGISQILTRERLELKVTVSWIVCYAAVKQQRSIYAVQFHHSCCNVAVSSSLFSALYRGLVSSNVMYYVNYWWRFALSECFL